MKFQQHTQRSIRFTQAYLVGLFLLALVGMCFGARIVEQIMRHASPYLTGNSRYYTLLISGYCSGSMALVVIVQLFQLITRIQHGDIFTSKNVETLHLISWEVGIVSCIAIVVGLTCYIPVLMIALASVLITLIIQVVRNAFAQAVQMKDELDYTI